MKAVAVFPGKREVQILDHPEPALTAASQVKLRMLEVGVCGTDKEIVAFQYGTPPDGCDYLIIGHESLGEVVEAGSSGLREGDLVVPTVRRPCLNTECIACPAGRQDFCYTGEFTERGIKQEHGFMTEYVVEDERYLNKVPASLRPWGVLVEPLTIAEKAIEQVRDVQNRLPWKKAPGGDIGTGHQAVVLGAGPVGLLGAMALRVAGFDVWVYSRQTPGDGRAGIVSAMGAHFLDAERTPVSEITSSLGHTLDLVYEAVGASSLAFEFLKALGPNGVFIFTGVPGRKAPIEVDTDLLMRDFVLKNQIVFGTVNAPRSSFEAAVRDLSIFAGRWPDALSRILTNRIPIDRALDPLSGKVAGIKNIITL